MFVMAGGMWKKVRHHLEDSPFLHIGPGKTKADGLK